jgi:hypothetical protein
MNNIFRILGTGIKFNAESTSSTVEAPNDPMLVQELDPELDFFNDCKEIDSKKKMQANALANKEEKGKFINS